MRELHILGLGVEVFVVPAAPIDLDPVKTECRPALGIVLVVTARSRSLKAATFPLSCVGISPRFQSLPVKVIRN